MASTNSLSTLLWNATSNATYLTAASTSYEFLYNVFYSVHDGDIADGISASDGCSFANGELGWLPQDAALFVESAYTLGKVTGNTSLTEL